MLIWQFASRYFFAKKSTQAINIIAWVSMAAIAVGAAALIIGLSVFNGFEDLVKSLYSSFYPAVKVSPATGKTMLVPADTLRALQGVSGVQYISRVIEEKGALRYNNQQTIGTLLGVDSVYRKISGVPGKVIRGEYNTGSAETPVAVVGVGIEAALGIDVERSFIPITVYLPKKSAGADMATASMMPEEALNVGQINPVGTFAIQQEFDNHYILTNIGYLQQLEKMPPDEVTALQIGLYPGADMQKVKKQVSRLLGDRFIVETRYEQNRSLYSVMQLEKWAVYAILSFILIIAAFNMIGSLSMLVIEKEKDITILKAMGIRNRIIRRIFLSEGLFIAFAGAAVGMLIAVTLCLLQKKYGFIKLGGGTFVVDAYPVSMHVFDFVLVFITILVISWLASWYPAYRASMQEIELKAQ